MKKIIKLHFFAAFLLVGNFLQAQTSNQVWFVTWNGQPTPSGDVSVQSIATAGGASSVTSGAANYFVSQTNYTSFNSPYDIAVDPAMGKVYVLDNNAQGVAPEYIYSFNLAGTPAQIAASGQIIYTMPIPQADVNANLYPLVSGIALDPVNHYLYFNQIDVTTSSNSYIGRLNLASSSSSDVFSSSNSSPVLQTFYAGQIPSQGPIAVDGTNIYIGAISGPNANDGVYAAPLSGSGAFFEIITNSSGDTIYANGFVSGVASYSQSNLIYYLTFNAGVVNNNYDLNQNAIWAYNIVSHTKTKIGWGYSGYPDNIALDIANNRYYFTVGRDGTGNISPTNYQAIYTGTLGSTNAPTLFYTPMLGGQDIVRQPNAGRVSLQGIYIQDLPTVNNASPVVGFVAAPTNGFAPLSVTFTNISSGGITNWVWNFGDGRSVTNVSGVNVNHAYSVSGTNTVTLIVNGAGGSSTNTQAGCIVISPRPVFSGTMKLPSNGGLALSGNNGPAGVKYRILTSTNIALALANWTPVCTNVFAPNGTYGYTNSSLAGNGSYFILVSP